MDKVDFYSEFGHLKAVGNTILSNPLYLFKPVTSFKDSDPLYFAIFLLIGFTLYTYIRCKQTNDVSWVDRMWSLAPIFYTGSMVYHKWYHTQKWNDRLGLIFLLQFAWGARLTYNFYIKGGYKIGTEDYRWATVQTWFAGKPYQWELFILFFIHIYQMISIWMFSVLPTYIIYYGPSSMKLYDLPLVFLFSIFFVIETIADYQMFEFQEYKKQLILKRQFSNIDKRFSQGFYQNGLYKYSRHPNYFGELGMWWTIYFLTCVTSPLNWTIIGVLNLCFIIYKSTGLTESLTTFKYPPYKYYAKRTSCLIPWCPQPEKKKKSQ